MGTRLAVMISRLEINGFRNHRSTQMDFERLTVIAGPNGVGKTNALRALKRFSPQPDTSFVPSVKKGRNFELYGSFEGEAWKAAANQDGNWIEISKTGGGGFRKGAAVFSN